MIDKHLQLLSPEDRAVLTHAFNEGDPHFVKVNEGKNFIGVNIKTNNQMTVTEEAGLWSYGEIK